MRKRWRVVALAFDACGLGLFALLLLGSPAGADAWFHSAAAEKALAVLWTAVSGIASGADGQYLYGRGRTVGASANATYNATTHESTFAAINTGPCNPAQSTCTEQWPVNTVCDCLMPDNQLPAGTCNLCLCADSCLWEHCEGQSTPQKLVCPGTTTTVSTSSTSTTSTSTTSTSTTSSSTSSTIGGGCTVSGTLTQAGDIDNFRAAANGDNVANRPRQRVYNTSAITICQISLCLGAASPPLDGTVQVQVWDALGAGGAPNAQIGSDSSAINGSTITTTMTAVPAGPCGGTNTGQVVNFTWTGTKPAPPAEFWIVLKRATGGPDVLWGTNTDYTSYQANGDGVGTHVYDLFDNNTDVAEDGRFTVWTQ